MKIVHKDQDKYGLHKIGKNRHRIMKILRDYDNEKEAVDDLTRLIVGEITEEKLIGVRRKSSKYQQGQ